MLYLNKNTKKSYTVNFPIHLKRITQTQMYDSIMQSLFVLIYQEQEYQVNQTHAQF